MHQLKDRQLPLSSYGLSVAKFTEACVVRQSGSLVRLSGGVRRMADGACRRHMFRRRPVINDGTAGCIVSRNSELRGMILRSHSTWFIKQH